MPPAWVASSWITNSRAAWIGTSKGNRIYLSHAYDRGSPSPSTSRISRLPMSPKNPPTQSKDSVKLSAYSSLYPTNQFMWPDTVPYRR
jgi:hypothetical protein